MSFPMDTLLLRNLKILIVTAPVFTHLADNVVQMVSRYLLSFITGGIHGIGTQLS